MIGGLSRTSRVKRVNMESFLVLVNDVFFRELWNSKSNYRDSWFPIFNSREMCAWTPPPPPPLRPSTRNRENLNVAVRNSFFKQIFNSHCECWRHNFVQMSVTPAVLWYFGSWVVGARGLYDPANGEVKNMLFIKLFFFWISKALLPLISSFFALLISLTSTRLVFAQAWTREERSAESWGLRASVSFSLLPSPLASWFCSRPIPCTSEFRKRHGNACYVGYTGHACSQPVSQSVHGTFWNIKKNDNYDKIY